MKYRHAPSNHWIVKRTAQGATTVSGFAEDHLGSRVVPLRK
jgi:hypothetical protein